MYILNKKTGLIQECHNSDAISACRKETEKFSLAETCEELSAIVSAVIVEKPEPDVTPVEGQEPKIDPGEVTGQTDKTDYTEEELNGMTVADLKSLAKKLDIQGCTNMTKETLVAVILNH